jgi:hypothetical protein
MQIERDRERWRGKRRVRKNLVKIVKERVIGRGRKRICRFREEGRGKKEKSRFRLRLSERER